MGVNATVQYGPNMETLAGCLSVYQFIPYKRMTEFFRGLFNFSLSQGTIDNLLERLSGKAFKVLAKNRKCSGKLGNTLIRYISQKNRSFRGGIS
ncbi:MAG: hypothetical protein MI784_10875 [Cytophagales bacterium]|nr:hypothetical protein [Cytophagales bacterium]